MRTWDELVTELEDLASEMRAKEQSEEPEPEPPPDGEVITVPPGASLQDALNAAPSGAVIELASCTDYPGRAIIKKACTLRTGGITLDGGVRVTPELATAMFARLPDGIEIRPGSTNVYVERLSVGGKNLNDIIEIGKADDTQATADKQPTEIALDQVYVSGSPTEGAKRGVAAQGKRVRIARSTIVNIFRAGQDTQCICGWNGEGPFLISDCHLEAAGENVMFGGSNPIIPGLVPTNIEIAYCTITKPIEWKTKNYTVKNLVEFKNGRDIYIHDCELSNSWAAGQMYALVLTPVNDGKAPQATVENYRFERNTVLDVSCGFNILGLGQQGPTECSKNITIRDCWFRISKYEHGGQGWFLQLGNGPENLVVEYCTIEADGNQFIQGNYGPTTPGFRFERNIVKNTGTYGTFLTWQGTNYQDGIHFADYFPGGILANNALAGDDSAFKKNYPNNLHKSTAEAASLVVDGYGVGAFEGYGRRHTSTYTNVSRPAGKQ